MKEKQTVYLVKVSGHPGHGGRFGKEEDAIKAQKLLARIYKKVRIVKKAK